MFSQVSFKGVEKPHLRACKIKQWWRILGGKYLKAKFVSSLIYPISLSTAGWKPVGKSIQKSLFLFQLPTLCIYYMNSHSSVNLESDISSTTSILVQTAQYSFKSLLHD